MPPTFGVAFAFPFFFSFNYTNKIICNGLWCHAMCKLIESWAPQQMLLTMFNNWQRTCSYRKLYNNQATFISKYIKNKNIIFIGITYRDGIKGSSSRVGSMLKCYNRI